jgi:diketogulonate reductase-like aldo/keto reductase
VIPTQQVRTVALPSGEPIPVLGQGTWHLAEGVHPPDVEISALRLGLDLGMQLVDTAEMYADGAAERLVGRAIAGRRDEVFLVDKVLPHHATARGTVAACRASLHRLGTDRIDLYLLHWRGPVPLVETLEGFAALISDGLIRYWGVSNFDVDDLAELARLPGGGSLQTDQVLYNLTRRGIERDLLPRCRRAGLPITAYSPIEQGRLLRHRVLHAIAAQHDVTAAQVALAWVLHHDLVTAIPRAGSPRHVQENHDALAVRLTTQDLAALDRVFPPPTDKRPLEML